MKKRRAVGGIALALVLLFSAGTGHAAGPFAVGVKAGTTGLGLEGTLGVSDRVNLRASVSGLDYSTDVEEDDIEYDGTLKVRSAGVLADWYPFGGRFRLSAGGFYNGNEFRGSAQEEGLPIGEGVYDARLDAEVDWRRFAPYLGIGWGNALAGGRLSFSSDIGVLFTGSPRVRLDGTTNNPVLEEQFREDVRREEESLEDDLEDLKYYPVISVALSYRF
ncbi:hypothetical protein ACN2MM_00320 [Alkalilimnicola ehrlichii MLHE-1]|uniref:Uncharacterized protein with a C-terminal OMP (Outer membrane protein) domain protein n=1 Tax=Alkalilimnicola ehrlichii (strain ATCC BAA-1101 / DSM 17681 / MLHE-1) TaxID=187272 RepID=Q0A4N9_ALKEH|nr:hypothetical protein [Alkalilimnicola ehrlichii]ABI58198.1 uncharacterized protein with a C-terminal OMP (outer membrane protein) domain protein [Alkalilimnicola ehrlichii MLHE-1]